MEVSFRGKIQRLSIFTAACLTSDSMLYIVLPIYWRSVGLTALWQVGVILSLNRLVRFIINPIVGLFYQRYGIKTGLIVSLIMTTVVTIGYVTLKGFAFWCTLRILWGCAWSLLRIGGLATLTLADSENRGQLMGMYNGLYRIGSLVGTLLGGITAPILGLRGIALVFLPLPLVFFPLLKSFGYIITPPTSSSMRTKATFRLTLGSSFSSHMTLLNGLIISMVFQGIFTSTLSTSISDSFNGHTIILGITFSTVFISGFIQSARWAWEPFLAVQFGKWTDRSYGRLPLQTILFVLSGLGFLGLIVGNSSIESFILVSLFVLATATGLTTTSDSLASDCSRRRQNVNILSLYSVLQDMGAAIGPMLGYFLASVGGFRLTYSTTGGLMLGLSILWAMITYKNSKNNHSSAMFNSPTAP